MKRASLALAAMALVMWAGAAFAHHSAAQFDFTKSVSQEGLVKEIRVINPHMALTFEVKDASGTHDILYEGHSANNFYRMGWRSGMIKAGDHIKVTFAPRRDGKEGGFVTGFTTAEGKDISFKMPGVVAPELPKDATTPGATPTKPAGQ
jgi:hypothetical protein